MGYRWNDVLLGYTNTNICTYKYFYRPDKQETGSYAPEKKQQMKWHLQLKKESFNQILLNGGNLRFSSF